MQNSWIEQFLHNLIPTALRDELPDNSAIYIRVRALTAVLLSVTLICVVINISSAIYHYLEQPELLKIDVATMCISLLLLSQVWLFYSHNNYWLSGLIFTNLYFILVVVFIVLNGGYQSPGKTILFSCPMISFLIGGKQEGLQNTFLSLFCLVAIIMLEYIDFDLPDLFAGEDPLLFSAVNWAVSVVIMTVCVLVYDVELHRRGERLDARIDPTQDPQDNLSSSIEKLLGKITPTKIRNQANLDTLAFSRARILALSLNLATILCFLSAVFLVGYHALFKPDLLKYDWIITAITLLFALQLWLYYALGNLRLSASLLGYFFMVMVVALALASGGHDAPTIALILLCPILFFIVGGIRQGLLGALLTLSAGPALAWLKHNGYVFENLFVEASTLLTFGIAWSVTLIAIACCMMVYDTELEKPG
jgi:hypothetical protein